MTCSRGKGRRISLALTCVVAGRNIREWQLGVLFFAVGNIMNFVSLGMRHLTWQLMGLQAETYRHVGMLTMPCTGFAAQSILAALGSVQFVSNVVFAWFVLQEKVRLLWEELGRLSLASWLLSRLLASA